MLLIAFLPVQNTTASDQRVYEEVSSDAGIGGYFTSDGMTSGATAADYDNDGDIDLFIPNGGGTPDQLYQNQGNGQFLEIAQTAGVDSMANNRAALFFDADNDNLLDLLVVGDCWCGSLSCIDPVCDNDISLVFYRQTAPGQFSEDTAAAGFTSDGIVHGRSHIGGMSAGDINNDGFLDVFLGLWRGTAQLFLNQTDGTFADIASSANVAVVDKDSWQPMMYDFNGDGFLDIYENIDFSDNHLWINQQDDTFVDMAMNLQVNNCVGTDCMNDMGLTLSDYDNDLDIDIYITNISSFSAHVELVDYNVLYRNDSTPGTMAFADVSKAADVAKGGWGWGCTFMELDNDGWVDLAVTNGMGGIATTDWSVFFKNNGDSPVTFSDVSDDVGFNDTLWGSSLISFDYDRDGYLDVLQVAYGNPTFDPPLDIGEIRLLRNVDEDPNQPAANHHLVVKPRMCDRNRRAIGATVEVTAGSLTMMRLISAGTSLQGQEPAEAHFGLGTHTTVDQVVVHWPGNKGSTTLTNVAADQVLTVTRPAETDFDGSYKVDLKDLARLCGEWMATGSGLTADVNDDETVDSQDLSRLIEDWLACCPVL